MELIVEEKKESFEWAYRKQMERKEAISTFGQAVETTKVIK